MTIPCTCGAQLQPHDWLQNVCPEPPREVHDREMDEARDEATDYGSDADTNRWLHS